MPGTSLWAWNVSAPFYRWTYGPLAHELDRCVVRHLGDDLGGRVIADMGCGPGVATRTLLAHGAACVVAVDAIPAMLHQLEGVAGAVPVTARIEPDVFEPLREAHARDGFDAILFKRSLYHPRAEALQILRAAYRALRRGGSICIVHPEASLSAYAFGEPPRLRSHAPYHLFNRAMSRLGVLLGGEQYTLYGRADLLALAREVADSSCVETIPCPSAAFNLVAIRRPLTTGGA